MSDFLIWRRYDHAESDRLLRCAPRSGALGLIAAAARGDRDTIATLLDKGIDVNCHDGEALLWASFHGDVETTKMLLAAGADPSANHETVSYNAYLGRVAIVELLIDRGGDIHADEERALVCAACGGHNEMIDFLLAHGADLVRGGNDALGNAAHRGHSGTVRFLMNRGVDIHANENWATYCAAGGGQLDVLDTLLAAGASPNIGPCGDTPLRAAASGGHARIVVRLLAAGASADGPMGIPLAEASAAGHLDVVELLLDAGAHANLHDGLALRNASEAGHRQIARLLEKYRARSQRGKQTHTSSAGPRSGSATNGKERLQ